MAALGQLGAMRCGALMLLHVLVRAGEGLRRPRILAQQALHALCHALQQLRVDIIVAQPVGADFGNLVEQFARGVLVAHEEAGVGHRRTCQWYLQARQQGGRHRVRTLLLLHLLHQHAQQVEAVTVVAAQLGLRAMLTAQLRHHGRLQVGYAGGGAGLRLQACEDRIHGRARHSIAIRRCCAGMACLLQQRMQRAARGGGQARQGRAGRAVILESVLHQARPGAGRCRSVPAGQWRGGTLCRLRGATTAHRLGDDPPGAR